jgi:16S rRNA (guanine527-N7)-methyltransferase
MFAEMALRWNSSLGLFGRVSKETFWARHVLDSLQILPLVPPATRTAIDVGSGGGLPGLVLAISSDVEFSLVEPNKRKAAFLREAARITGTKVTVLVDRLENLDIRADLLTARAVARLPRLLGMAYPHLEPSGACVFLKGGSVAAEIKESSCDWEFSLKQVPSSTGADGTILLISHLRPK